MSSGVKNIFNFFFSDYAGLGGSTKMNIFSLFRRKKDHEAGRRTVGFDPNVAREIKALEHHDPRTREKAAQTLGRSAHPAALEPLLMLLDDPNTAVRLAALEAIQRISDPDFDGLDPKLAERLRRGPLTDPSKKKEGR